MRLWAAMTLVLLLGYPAHAEQFGDRLLRITDGRSDAHPAPLVPAPLVPAPLVIVLHGFTGSGAAMQRKTHFDALARRNGFVVAYPSGKARRWNHAGQARDDVAYLSALIEDLVAQGRADPARIFLAGHSNGGAMALRMACDAPTLIAGIAVVAMNAPRTLRCAQGAPLPVLFVHGDADPVVPPEGIAGSSSALGLLSVEETLALWSARNGCRGAPVRKTLKSSTAQDVALFSRYQNCRAPLLQVQIAGHGHEWPGAGPRARWIQGPASREVDAASLSWWFFSALRSPR